MVDSNLREPERTVWMYSWLESASERAVLRWTDAEPIAAIKLGLVESQKASRGRSRGALSFA